MYIKWKQYKLNIMVLLVLFISMLLCTKQSFALPAKVYSDTSIPPLIKARMEKTISNLDEQIVSLRGDSMGNIDSTIHEKIIEDVLDKVIIGYRIEKVVIDNTSTPHIAIKLQPWTRCIKNVNVDIKIDGMSSHISEIAMEDLAGLPKLFNECLKDLPLGAMDWSNGVLKQAIKEYMQEKLPEFRADFDIEPGEDAVAKVTIYPTLPIVRTIDLKMRSDTFPNIILLSVREDFQHSVNELIGVPVSFVKRHQEKLESYYANKLDSNSSFKRYMVSTKVKLDIAENMSIMSRSNTKNLRISGELWADLGHNVTIDDRDVRIRARGYLGYRFTETDEVFGYLDIYTRDFYVSPHIGYKREILKGLWGGVKYDTRESALETEIMYQITPKWFIRHEYRAFDNQSEYALRYRFHDFLGIEFVHDKNNNWFRLIGNF